jgi:hypothetical protein
MTSPKLNLPLFIFLGIAFWLNAALIIRYFGASVFTENNPWLAFFFIIAIPITLLSIWILDVISKLRFDQLFKPIVVLTITATLLDGIALTWFRSLYSQSFEVALYGAAWILWAVGWGLLFGLLLDTRKVKLDK